MPKITFTADHTPKGQAADRPHYKAGETYDVETSYAEKYKSRGLAVDEVVAPVKIEPVAETAETVAEAAPETRPEPGHHFGGRGKRR